MFNRLNKLIQVWNNNFIPKCIKPKKSHERIMKEVLYNIYISTRQLWENFSMVMDYDNVNVFVLGE